MDTSSKKPMNLEENKSNQQSNLEESKEENPQNLVAFSKKKATKGAPEKAKRVKIFHEREPAKKSLSVSKFLINLPYTR